MSAITKTPTDFIIAEYQRLHRQRAESLLALEEELIPQINAMQARLQRARDELKEPWVVLQQLQTRSRIRGLTAAP